MNHEVGPTHTYAKWLFSIAAAYNVIATAPFAIASTPAGQLFGLPPPLDPTITHLAVVLVLAFGWGYWRISRDPAANRPIIVLGMVGKSLVALVGYLDWLGGNASGVFALVVTGDAVFAALFFDYLRRTSPSQRTA